MSSAVLLYPSVIIRAVDGAARVRLSWPQRCNDIHTHEGSLDSFSLFEWSLSMWAPGGIGLFPCNLGILYSYDCMFRYVFNYSFFVFF